VRCDAPVSLRSNESTCARAATLSSSSHIVEAVASAAFRG
jgi:hypothetical protein